MCYVGKSLASPFFNPCPLLYQNHPGRVFCRRVKKHVFNLLQVDGYSLKFLRLSIRIAPFSAICFQHFQKLLKGNRLIKKKKSTIVFQQAFAVVLCEIKSSRLRIVKALVITSYRHFFVTRVTVHSYKLSTKSYLKFPRLRAFVSNKKRKEDTFVIRGSFWDGNAGKVFL